MTCFFNERTNFFGQVPVDRFISTPSTPFLRHALILDSPKVDIGVGTIATSSNTVEHIEIDVGRIVKCRALSHRVTCLDEAQHKQAIATRLTDLVK